MRSHVRDHGLIPSLITKERREPITYDIDCMEKYLKALTDNGVSEQVMLLSQLANFTRER